MAPSPLTLSYMYLERPKSRSPNFEILILVGFCRLQPFFMMLQYRGARSDAGRLRQLRQTYMYVGL